MALAELASVCVFTIMKTFTATKTIISILIGISSPSSSGVLYVLVLLFTAMKEEDTVGS